jgi:hypothetical protein
LRSLLRFCPAAHFHDLFRRHQNIAEAVLHAECSSMRSFSAAATFFS